MKPTRAGRQRGAEPRLESSPFGKPALRHEWSERIDQLKTLRAALETLRAYRETLQRQHLTDADELWIEARLEEKVAVLRFAELSFDDVRHRTLTGEDIADVRRRFENAAKATTRANSRRLAAEFRQRYKPPVMPTADFLPIEVILSERLTKRRSLGWFDESIASLRLRRGAIVIKDGWPG